MSRACLRLAGMASTGGESCKGNLCEIDVQLIVHPTQGASFKKRVSALPPNHVTKALGGLEFCTTILLLL